MNAPREGLYRGLPLESRLLNLGPEPVALRTGAEFTRDAGDTETSTTMVGHFAVFGEWTRISSWFEGEFLERIAPGAFTKTIAERRDMIRVQFDHGFDSFVGDAPLGPIAVLREDDIGVWYEVPLLDTDYNRNRVLPMLEGRTMSGEQFGSLLGASFRFSVVREEWNDEPERSDYNRDGLPERTITELKLAEFGPVVFPAYHAATAGVRSLTDHYLERTRELRSRQSDVPAGSTTGTDDTDAPSSAHPPVESDGNRSRRVAVTSARAQLERTRSNR
jgi:HK97 family phage prohead protease